MSLKRIIPALLAIVGLGSAFADEPGPAWEANGSMTGDVTVVAAAGDAGDATTSFPAGAPTSPAALDAEIVQLAKALNHDPVRIFNYVRNQIDYEHYYGLRKGALMTLLEGGGNDFDQCALLADLLRAAGHSNVQFRYRSQRVEYAQLKDWVGLADEVCPGKTFVQVTGKSIATSFPDVAGLGEIVAKQAVLGQRFLADRGSRWGVKDAAVWRNDLPGKASFVLDRLYLTVSIGGSSYSLDPAYKQYEKIQGVGGLLAAMGYNRDTLLNQLGGTSDADYVKSLNESNAKTELTNLTTNFLQYVSANHPNLTVRELLGGRRIIKSEITNLSQGLPLAQFEAGWDLTWDSIPTECQSKICFATDTTEVKVIPTSELKGRKISLTFSGSNMHVRLDDGAPIATVPNVEESIKLTMTLDHPWRPNDQKQTATYRKRDDFAYAIIYGFTASGQLLQKRNDQLAKYRAAGKLDSSREVRTETLNVMGLTWLYQTELIASLLANQNDVAHLFQYRFGRMAQEEGFYVDVSLQASTDYPTDGDFTDGRFDNIFHLAALFHSAMEHGIIEQMQPGYSAVSTVNILRRANSTGERVYKVDPANPAKWATIKAGLDHYTPENLDTLEAHVLTDKAYLFLPEDAEVEQGNWLGTGWVVRGPTKAGMIIGGKYNGGYATSLGFVGSNAIMEMDYFGPGYMAEFSASLGLGPASPQYFGADPVNMANGTFEYAHTDMETGVEGAPRGLAFARSYSSANRMENRQNLGHGWSHSLHIRAAKRTATEETLGLGSIRQAAPLIVAALVGQDLYQRAATPKEWMAAVLTVGWFQDSMLNNAVSITMGDNTVQFIKQPNGSYEPPAGSTASLQMVSGDFRFSERHGNTIHFEKNTTYSLDNPQRAKKIVDPDGKELTYDYYSDDRIKYVQDCYGRRYTFVYADNLISGITDSTGRSIAFTYDGFENLTGASDPEGKFQYFDYQVSGDPGGTLARDHRIVRLRNHDGQAITQNVYDSLGRVTEQFLHGDPGKVWKLRFTGLANTEENPSGGITTFFYDEQGRSTGKIDPSGVQESRVYDVHDRIVSKTTGSGETTTYVYDTRHNLTQVNHPRGGGSTQMFYDSLDRVYRTIDPDGRQTDNVYNSGNLKNRPDQVIDPAGTTTYLYKTSGPAVGRVSKVTDGNGLFTEYEYDSYGHPDWVKEPGAFQTQFTYSIRGDLLDSTNPNGVKTANLYNARRQVTKTTTDQGGASESVEDFVYDNQGLLARKTDAADNGGQRFSTRYEYSATEKQRFVRTSDNDGEDANDPYTEITYDGRDWQTTSRDAGSRLTSFTPKPNGQPWKTTIPLNREKIQLQDGDGRPTGGTVPGSPQARSTSLVYDVAPSSYPRTKTTTPDQLEVSEVQDRTGNPRFYTNRKGNVWEFRYDGLGRKTHVITPLDATGGRASITEYHHRGAVKKLTEPSGQITNFTYHATSGRLLTVADGVGTISHTSYDNNGNLLTTTETRSGVTKTTTRTYDRQNRLASRTDENGHAVGYRYYPSGKLWKIVYPGGTDTGTGHVEYTWWQDGTLKQVLDKLDSTTTPRVTSYFWNKDGRLAKVSRPNGTTREVKYDGAGRPNVIEEYGPNLQLIWVHKHGFHPSDEMAWQYELPAKLTSGTDPPAMGAMTYNADNQLATWGGLAVSHDFDGNMISGPGPDGATLTSFSYDSRNRLTAALGTTYTYDADGQRVKMVRGADTTTFVTDVSAKLSKLLVRTKNGVSTRYVWGAGLLYEVNGSGGSATTVSYHHNASGSTMALTNGAGGVIERIDYTPWGQTRSRTNVGGSPHDTPFLFTGFFGNQTDANGLLYMRARYYHARIGRFLNVDPAQEGMNWYGYAGGNPIGMVDPMGLGAEGALDKVQTVLSYLGMLPVVGAGFDLVNAGISFARGNYVDGFMNLASALPGIGDAVGGAKIAATTAGLYGAYRGGMAIEKGLANATRGRIFYVGEGAETLARNIAAETGYKTIYNTWYGKVGEKVTPYLSQDAGRKMWGFLSGRFARGAKQGDDVITVFGRHRATGQHTLPIDSKSAWVTVEYPVLNSKNIQYRSVLTD